MAIIYLRSTDGLDADSGLTWALAKATLVAAMTAAGAGGTVYVSQSHAETQATALTINGTVSASTPMEIICVNDSAEPPTTKATTATVTTTLASPISFTGHANVYGVTFNSGTGGSGTSMSWTSTSALGWMYHTCGLNIVGNNTTNRLNIGSLTTTAAQSFRFINCSFTFASVSQFIVPGRSRIQFIGCTFSATGSVPTILMTVGGGGVGPIGFRGCDLSAFGSGKSIASLIGAVGGLMVRLVDCKLGASVTLSGSFSGPDGAEMWADNCDSGGANYKFERSIWEGDVFSETVIVRTGGASDGVTPISHRFVSSANVGFHRPFYGPWMTIRNELTGSAKTLTIEVVHDSATGLKDNEAWVELEYLGVSGSSRSLVADDRTLDILTAAADQASSSVTWTTTGFVIGAKKQKFVATFTPQEKGVVRCRVAMAKASYTLYVDPDPVIA